MEEWDKLGKEHRYIQGTGHVLDLKLVSGIIGVLFILCFLIYIYVTCIVLSLKYYILKICSKRGR